MAHGPVTRPSLPRIRLAAPTGRAAQRLAESIQRSLQGVRYPSLGAVEVGSETATEITLDQYVANLSCETLHSLLRYNPGTGEYFYHQHRPIPADLVLIDEVSMVDIFVLARLLNALEENASLVILGDRDQLPPIDSGSVLADLIQCKNVIDHPLRNNIAILEHSHRSKAGILDVTRKINAQDGIGAMESMGTTPTPDEGCHLILPHGPGASPQGYRSGWKNCLDSWVHAHYLRQGAYGALIEKLSTFKSMEEADFKVVLTELFICLDQSRILTFTRKGWHGCVTINQTVREILLRKWDPQAALKSSDGFHGSPILILQNEYSKGLFNGDVGIFLRIQGRPIGFFRRGDDFVNFPTTFLPRYETAFAMTIHKSQGSEYDQVLLVLPESGNRLLSKETLYTAITRAKYFAGIYGSREVFLEAIANKVERESGLPDYLRGLADTEIMEPK
jgi:exodeoxyribonuclease V alpha subunit